MPMTASDPQPLIALIAGEESGDVLGARLAKAIMRRWPDARLVGVGGARMQAAGVDCWWSISALSVMGIAEVLRHLPRLLRLRRQLARRLLQARPDVVIGIDAPDFNLGLEKRLKQNGLTTVHYVSPSVWAWREGRARRIGQSADRVLCLFPMEPPIYARHGVDARFVGHPLASRYDLTPDHHAARQQLGLPDDAPVLALLPGSRGSEIERLADIFLQASARVTKAKPGLQILLPAANTRIRDMLEDRLSRQPDNAAGKSKIHLLDGQADRALRAADVALLASGTVALEAMLAQCPMVVGYRISPLTYRMVRSLKLMKTSLFSLPNVLAGEAVVPELMQEHCQPEALADAVLAWFEDPHRSDAVRQRFAAMHQQLLGNHEGSSPADQAAAALTDFIHSNPTRTNAHHA